MLSTSSPTHLTPIGVAVLLLALPTANAEHQSSAPSLCDQRMVESRLHARMLDSMMETGQFVRLITADPTHHDSKTELRGTTTP